MEREALGINWTKWNDMQERARNRASEDGGLARALCTLAPGHFVGNAFENTWRILTGIYGKAPTELQTIEEFWAAELKDAIGYLAGEKTLADIEEMSRIQLECQYSKSLWRRSYRTKDVGYHACCLVPAICSWMFLPLYEKSVKEIMLHPHDRIAGYDMYLALEIRRENEEVIDLLREAILGDNGEVLLSKSMIRAVIISGNEELLDLLLKLLSAAGLQEGLRQQILESADEGNITAFIKILKHCVDQDMFRYSGAVRAFNTWTGLGYENTKTAVNKKCAVYAYECLSNTEIRERYLSSEDNLKVYLAMWSMGCFEFGKTDVLARRLLDDEKKYRRILGWLFVSRTDSSRYRMMMAAKYMEERDEEILAWAVNNLSETKELLSCHTHSRNGWGCEPVKNPDLPEDPDKRQALFYKLKDAAEFIGNKKRTFTGNPFAFNSITLEKARVVNCMMSLAGYDMDRILVDEMTGLLPVMNTEQRRAFYTNFLDLKNRPEHRKLLRAALEDRSPYVKELAAKRLADCNLDKADMDALKDSLCTKNSGVRKSVLTVLLKQEPEQLAEVIGELLSSVEEYQIQAGIELLYELKEEYPFIEDQQQEKLKVLQQSKLSTQTLILLEQLLGEKKHFGLYDSEGIETYTGKGSEGELFTEEEMRQIFPSQMEFEALFDGLNEVIKKHADYEYEVMNHDGSREKILFGNSGNGLRIPSEYGIDNGWHASGGVKFHMIPFCGEFKEAAGIYARDIKKMAGMCYAVWNRSGEIRFCMERMPWLKAFLEKGMNVNYSTAGNERYKMRYMQLRDIVQMFVQFFDPHEVFTFAIKCYRSVISILGRENLGRIEAEEEEDHASYRFYHSGEYPVNHWTISFFRQMAAKAVQTEEDFAVWFSEEHNLEYELRGIEVNYGLSLEDYFHAADKKLAAEEVLCEKLLRDGSAEHNIRMLTNRWFRGSKLYESYPWAKEFVNKTVLRIVEVEEKRGELPTPLTGLAKAIGRFEGAEHFCSLLAALGKENFFRGYVYSSNNTKQAVLSHLLESCYPAKEDTPEKLKTYLQRTDIHEKRLVEASMYAPQWAGFAEEILKWPGFKCAVWFFHAHMNELLSEEKEAEVAFYSSITPRQFCDGAFDRDWFFRAYNKLGEKRFKILYQAAKYITAGGNRHRRPQLYADAVLGKLNAEELKAEIMEKRNPEKLRCYPLIPIPEENPGEALERYEFIQKFLKESSQFGIQRRESEKRACAAALENLAITTGFKDTNLMIWYLEGRKTEELRKFMEPREVEGIQLWIEVGEDGTAGLVIQKDGERLKTLPKNLAKNEEVLVLKEKVKELKEQKKRARESLERAMTECTWFGSEELQKISGNPVLAPMLFALVWTDGLQNGFLEEEKKTLLLREVKGEKHLLPGNARLRIAHPHDLRQAGEWADYMHLLYVERRIQPFKQIFREYYPLTEDECQEKTRSRRYAGHQVQPKKTIALLKSRGWIMNYEAGLLKVIHQENMFVQLFSLADWFTPAEIEAPAIETICFFDLETGRPVELQKIPPVLFSEIMRDVDLVVSTAHAGGADPMASHSTIEMRLAIGAELIKLLKISNVEFIGSHAKIHGSLADYSVHMGSGVVHAGAVGMLAILPVHSHARGRIFLPFADDDPKTAEIMSKIILLAEDKKIKDPSILSQITG